MNKLKDIIKAIGNIFCPCIKAIKNRLSPYIDDLGEYFQDNIGTQKDRFKLYLLMLVSGVILCLFHNPILWFLMLLTSLGTNPIFASAIAILLLTLPAVTFNWWLKNHDQLQQFEYTKKQQEHNSEQIALTKQQQNEAQLNNAVQSLRQNDILTKSFGLKELMRLRHATEKELIRLGQAIKNDELIKRIDLITSSGLELKGAKLNGADLRGAKLQGADLLLANLRWADLRGTKLKEAELRGVELERAGLQGGELRRAELEHAKNLQEAKLQGAIYNDATTLPTWLNNAEERDKRGMIHEDDLPKEP